MIKQFELISLIVRCCKKRRKKQRQISFKNKTFIVYLIFVDDSKKEDLGNSNIKLELSENCETEIAENTNSHAESSVNVSPNQQSQDSQNKSDNNISVIVTIKQPIKEISPEERRTRIEEIRQGWTTENCASLTIGEMYLMVFF